MWNLKKWYRWDFPGGTVNGNLPANAGDTDLLPGLGGFHMPLSNKAHAPNYWTCVLQGPGATTVGPVCCSPRARAPQQEKRHNGAHPARRS